MKNIIVVSLSYHNLKSYDRDFNLRCNFITELFSAKLASNNFHVDKLKKVSISLIKNEKTNVIIKDGSVILFESDFILLDSTYEICKSSKHDRLKLIFNAFMILAEKYGWEKSLIYKTYEDCLNIEIVNEFYFGELKLSKDKKIGGRIFCQHDETKFTINLDIFDSDTNKRIKREKLVSTEAIEVAYRDWLVDLKVGKDCFYIQPKGDREKIVINY